MPPPTVIVVHRRENPKKCSVAPLEGREGFVFWRYPFASREPLPGYVQLGMSGILSSDLQVLSRLVEEANAPSLSALVRAALRLARDADR